MLRLSVCMAYYDNPVMLGRHLAAWEALPVEMRQALEFIICDDGSPRWPVTPLKIEANLQVFRIQVDVRWNQDAARNICARFATAPWLLFTDIDHFIPTATFAALLALNLDKRDVYRFSRVTALDVTFDNVTPYKPHPNSWLMTRDMFERIGGYDERLAGYYGTDADFRDSVQRHARATMVLRQALVRVPRDVIPDASTTTYARKADVDKGLSAVKRERDRIPHWRPQRFRYPFEHVSQCSL